MGTDITDIMDMATMDITGTDIMDTDITDTDITDTVIMDTAIMDTVITDIIMDKRLINMVCLVKDIVLGLVKPILYVSPVWSIECRSFNKSHTI